jgi:hypothetical protein
MKMATSIKNYYKELAREIVRAEEEEYIRKAKIILSQRTFSPNRALYVQKEVGRA